MSKPITIADIDLTQSELSQHELQTIHGGLTTQSLNPGRTAIAVGSAGWNRVRTGPAPEPTPTPNINVTGMETVTSNQPRTR